MTLAPGTRLGPYQIVDELGDGGMGALFIARAIRVSVATWPSRSCAGALPAITIDVSASSRKPKRRRALSHPSIVDLGLALSPDGKHLLFTKIDYLGADLMLIEQFP